jgi:hypothetical protein
MLRQFVTGFVLWDRSSHIALIHIISAHRPTSWRYITDAVTILNHNRYLQLHEILRVASVNVRKVKIKFISLISSEIESEIVFMTASRGKH